MNKKPPENDRYEVFKERHNLLYMSLLQTTTNFYICGGAAAYLAGFTEGYTDIDVYCSEDNLEEVQRLADRLCTVGKENYFRANLQTDNSIHLVPRAYKESVQLILPSTNHGSIETILSNFDLNYSMCALDIVEEQIYFDPSILTKKLLVNRIQDNPILTAKRIAKYLARTNGVSLDSYGIFNELFKKFENSKLIDRENMLTNRLNNYDWITSN